MTQKFYILNRLRRAAHDMRREADNLSPFNDDGSGGDAHPAPEIRKWARIIEQSIEDLSAS